MDLFFQAVELPPDLLKELKKYGQQANFKPKDIIVYQGQHMEVLYFIEIGFVKYTIVSTEGSIQTLCYLGKGFFLGEYPYICSGNISIVSIEAATRVQLLSFSQNVKNNLYAIEGFKRLLLRNMSNITRFVQTQIKNISLNNTEQRIQKTLKDAEEYFAFLKRNNINKSNLTKREIAELSGCSLETFNRLIKVQKKDLLDKK